MRNSSLLVLASLFAATVVSCTGKKSGEADASAAAEDATRANAGSPSAASTLGDAGWSATIDGAPVAGTGVDELQQNNAAYILPVSGAGAKHLIFHLFSTKNGADESANFGLRFSLPPTAGTYTKKGYTEHGCDCDLTLNENIAKGGELARYSADSVVITVTGMTATRLTGTFAGSFVLSGDTPRAPNKRAKTVGGKFDIPMATSKITPE